MVPGLGLVVPNLSSHSPIKGCDRGDEGLRLKCFQEKDFLASLLTQTFDLK